MINRRFLCLFADCCIAKGNFHINSRLYFISVCIIESNIYCHDINDFFSFFRQLLFHSCHNCLSCYWNRIHGRPFRERSFRCVYGNNSISCRLGKCLSWHCCLGLCLSFCFCLNFRFRLRFNLSLGFHYCLCFSFCFRLNRLRTHTHDRSIRLDPFDDVLVRISGCSCRDTSIYQHFRHFESVCRNYGEHDLAVLCHCGAVGYFCSVYCDDCILCLEGYQIFYCRCGVLLGRFIGLSLRCFRFGSFAALRHFLGNFLVADYDLAVLGYIGNLIFILHLSFRQIHVVQANIFHLIAFAGCHGELKGLILFYLFIIGRNIYFRLIYIDGSVNGSILFEAYPVGNRLCFLGCFGSLGFALCLILGLLLIRFLFFALSFFSCFALGFCGCFAFRLCLCFAFRFCGCFTFRLCLCFALGFCGCFTFRLCLCFALRFCGCFTLCLCLCFAFRFCGCFTFRFCGCFTLGFCGCFAFCFCSCLTLSFCGCFALSFCGCFALGFCGCFTLSLRIAFGSRLRHSIEVACRCYAGAVLENHCHSQHDCYDSFPLSCLFHV